MSTALALLSPATLPMVTSADVLEAFLAGRKATTLAAYEADLEDFAKFLSVPDAASAAEALVSATHGHANRCVLAYRAQMTERGLSAATIGRRLATLRSMIKIARQIGRISWAIDVQSPKSKPYRDTRGPTQEEKKKLFTEARRRATSGEGKRNFALIRLMYDMGLRRGECVSLDLVHVDVDRQAVEVMGKARTELEWITIPRETLEALRDWIAVRGNHAGPLFIALDRAAGKRAGDGRLTGDSVCCMVHALSKAAGLTREARPHGLRHSAITHGIEMGVSLLEMQKFSRHAKIETLLIYNDNRRDDAGRVAKLLAADE